MIEAIGFTVIATLFVVWAVLAYADRRKRKHLAYRQRLWRTKQIRTVWHMGRRTTRQTDEVAR